MQALYDEFAATTGLRILAFPSNQFMNQEPGSNADIKQFTKQKFGVTFDLFAKCDVNGFNAIPLWKYLKMKMNVDYIKWNFTKFLIDPNGYPVDVYAPNISPNALRQTLQMYW